MKVKIACTKKPEHLYLTGELHCVCPIHWYWESKAPHTAKRYARLLSIILCVTTICLLLSFEEPFSRQRV